MIHNHEVPSSILGRATEKTLAEMQVSFFLCVRRGCRVVAGGGAVLSGGPGIFFRLVDRRSKKVAKNGLTVPVFADFQRFWSPSVQKKPDLWTDAPAGLLRTNGTGAPVFAGIR